MTELIKKLTELEDCLAELESEEPDDEENEELYAEWEARVDEICGQIEDIKTQLGENVYNIKRKEIKDYSIEEYNEFFKAVESALDKTDEENKKDFLAYAKNNIELTENIRYICDLIEKADGVSISYLQRRMGIGYAKAGNIVFALEDLGVIEGINENPVRKVLKTRFNKLKALLNE